MLELPRFPPRRRPETPPFRRRLAAGWACHAALALAVAGCDGLPSTLPATPGTTLASLVPPRSTLPPAAVPRPEADLPPAAAAPTAQVTVGHGNVAGAQTAPDLAPAPGDDVSFEFVDADMAAVARSILGETLHLNYTVDPKVVGKVTIQTMAPIKRNAVLPLIEDAFMMNGAAIVQANGQVAVVPADAAKFSLGAVKVGSNRGPGWRTQIVPLRYASAPAVAKSLEAIAPVGAAVHADAAHNVLLLTGSSTEIGNLLNAVAAFDVDSMANKSFGLWPLQMADARTLAADLEGLFGQTEAGDPSAAVRVLPIVRMNAVLVVAREPQTLRQAEAWIGRLDKVADGNEPQLFVYRVNAGRAGHLAELLSKLYPDEVVEAVGVERSGSVAPGQRPVQMDSPGEAAAASAAPDSFSPTATKTVAAAPGAGRGLAAPPPPGREAGPAAGVSLTPLSGDHGAPRGNGIRIIADSVNNSLLIQARPALYRQILKGLEKLDVMPSQVSIEATIIEVNLNNSLRFGTQFFLNSGKHGFKFTPNLDGTVGAIAPGFSYLWPVAGAKAVIDALRSVTDVSVVSSPTVMVLDNETAQLQVGDQVPVITATAQSVQTAGAPLVSQVEYHDTGVILTVTPRITATGVVMLDIHQEVSDVVATTSSTIDSPSFQRRRFHSSVAINDADTLALGGLIRNTRDQSRTGIPWLSELPVVGALMGDRDDTTGRTELLVMITPHIVRNQAEAAAATEEIRRRIQTTVTPRPSVLP